MRLDDLFDDRQSGACAWVLLARMQALENFKDALKMLGRNANTVIVYREAIVPRLFFTPNGDLRRLASGSKFQGITQQIAEDLSQADFRIEHDGQGLRHMQVCPSIGNFELQVVHHAVED